MYNIAKLTWKKKLKPVFQLILSVLFVRRQVEKILASCYGGRCKYNTVFYYY